MSKANQEFQTSLVGTARASQPTEPLSVSEADYEQMYNLLYAYRFGAISFLELLDKVEAILHIHAPHASRQMPG